MRVNSIVAGSRVPLLSGKILKVTQPIHPLGNLDTLSGNYLLVTFRPIPHNGQGGALTQTPVRVRNADAYAQQLAERPSLLNSTDLLGVISKYSIR